MAGLPSGQYVTVVTFHLIANSFKSSLNGNAGLASAPSNAAAGALTAVDERADEDGDVVMAEEEADQLLSSLQAARHDSVEWVSPQDHPSIAMLLYGQQVSHLCLKLFTLCKCRYLRRLGL